MATLNINISKSNERFPIHLQYEGQHEHQSCGLELDLRTGELTDFISGEIGCAVPINVWNNLVLRFSVNPYIMRDGLIAIAEEHREAFQMILDTSEIVWNGSNQVGRLSAEADNFIEEWEMQCYGHDGKYNVTIISVEDQMQYEQRPETKGELDALVKKLLSYDGDNGYYEKEPHYDHIESDVLDYMIQYVLQNGEEISPEIAALILECETDVGAWQQELEEFAALSEKRD